MFHGFCETFFQLKKQGILVAIKLILLKTAQKLAKNRLILLNEFNFNKLLRVCCAYRQFVFGNNRKYQSLGGYYA